MKRLRTRASVTWRRLSLSFATGASTHACATPECSSPDYGNAECRVLAENELARARTDGGVEIRFQEAGATTAESWAATGLVRVGRDDRVTLRVAGLGDFAVSLAATGGMPQTITVVLDNVHAATVVTVGPDGDAGEVPAERPGALQRELQVELADDRVVWIRGVRSCPERYRVAVLGDIQTNPFQFERIVERLAAEAAIADAAGTPLVGLLIAGDLSENSREDEFTTLLEILSELPFPTAVTAGNHDIYRPLHPLFNRYFGPGNHAFDVCGVHVAMLDTGSGSVADSVLARLPQLLDRGASDHLLTVMHHPPFPGITGSGWSREDMAALTMVELAASGTDLVLAGHNHALHDFPDVSIGDASLREIIVGTGGAYQGLGVPRYGYLRVEMSSDGVAPCFVEVAPAGLEEDANDPLRTLAYCEDS
jgi:hypothetical protein